VRTHRVIGGGDVGLHVIDQGPEGAPAILLIHGWSQAVGCWKTQAALADRFRVVAFDLRGHGASDKPADEAAYQDTALWGDDVKAVIDGLGLASPVLVGWSYGARVIASYVAEHGDDAIAGVVTTGGILALGACREDWMVGKSSPGRNPDLYADEDATRAAATRDFIAACTEEPLDDITTAEFVAFNEQCPAHVRRALFRADFDVRPVWQSLKRPLLSIHGAEDRVVLPICGIEASELAPNGDLWLYENCGHAPFIEHPDRFNADLAHFAQTAIGAAA
jgi:non-heme chloroperoxidase